MKSGKQIIITLIQQDLKHHQLTNGLRSMGFNSDLHTLNIIEVVADLIGVSEEEISEIWMDSYFSFLDQAHLYLKEGRSYYLWRKSVIKYW